MISILALKILFRVEKKILKTSAGLKDSEAQKLKMFIRVCEVKLGEINRFSIFMSNSSNLKDKIAVSLLLEFTSNISCRRVNTTFNDNSVSPSGMT